MREPQMTTGAREPRSARNAEAAGRSTPSAFAVIPDGKVVVWFIASQYRLQLTAPRDSVLPDGRISYSDRPLVAQARDHFLVLDLKDETDRKKWEMIQAHKSFGIDFKDYSKILADGKKKQAKQAIDTILNNPEILKDPDFKTQILIALEQSKDEDFQLPSGKGGQA